MMNKLLMCERYDHATPVSATRFFVLAEKRLDPNHAEFWQHHIEFHVYRECEECWKKNSEDYSDLQVSREDYLAALAMAEL